MDYSNKLYQFLFLMNLALWSIYQSNNKMLWEKEGKNPWNLAFWKSDYKAICIISSKKSKALEKYKNSQHEEFKTK